MVGDGSVARTLKLERQGIEERLEELPGGERPVE
jgi:hypothetical protein